MEPFEDYYGLLGVSRFATPVEIRRAYRNLALQLHPDRNPTGTSDTLFKKVSTAYGVLSDSSLKGQYDTKLFSEFRFQQVQKHASTPFFYPAYPPHHSSSSFGQDRPQTARPTQPQFTGSRPNSANPTMDTEERIQQDRARAKQEPRKQTVSGYGLSKDEISELDAMKRRHDAAQRVYEKMVNNNPGQQRPSTAATERTSTSAAHPVPPPRMSTGTSSINAHTVEHVLKQLQKERENIARQEQKAQAATKTQKENHSISDGEKNKSHHQHHEREDEVQGNAAKGKQEEDIRRNDVPPLNESTSQHQTYPRYPSQQAHYLHHTGDRPSTDDHVSGVSSNNMTKKETVSTSRQPQGPPPSSNFSSSSKFHKPKTEDPVDALEKEILRKERNIAQGFQRGEKVKQDEWRESTAAEIRNLSSSGIEGEKGVYNKTNEGKKINEAKISASEEEACRRPLSRPGSAKFSDGVKKIPDPKSEASAEVLQTLQKAAEEDSGKYSAPPVIQAQQEEKKNIESAKGEYFDWAKSNTSVESLPRVQTISQRPPSAQRPKPQERKTQAPITSVPKEKEEKERSIFANDCEVQKKVVSKTPEMMIRDGIEEVVESPKNTPPTPNSVHSGSDASSPFTPRYMYKSTFDRSQGVASMMHQASSLSLSQTRGIMTGELTVPHDDSISLMTDPEELKQLLVMLEHKAKAVRQTLLLQDVRKN